MCKKKTRMYMCSYLVNKMTRCFFFHGFKIQNQIKRAFAVLISKYLSLWFSLRFLTLSNHTIRWIIRWNIWWNKMLSMRLKLDYIIQNKTAFVTLLRDLHRPEKSIFFINKNMGNFATWMTKFAYQKVIKKCFFH